MSITLVGSLNEHSGKARASSSRSRSSSRISATQGTIGSNATGASPRLWRTLTFMPTPPVGRTHEAGRSERQTVRRSAVSDSSALWHSGQLAEQSRLVIQLICRPILNDVPVADHDDPVAFAGEGDGMRDEECCAA